MPARAIAVVLSLCAVTAYNVGALGEQTAAAPTPSARSASPARSVVWSEDFSGNAGVLPSKSRWTFETGGGGWGNGESQCYTSSAKNASTNGHGQLVITAIRSRGHLCTDGHRNAFTSARITTQHAFTATHGRLEVRAELPAGAGAWPAFWALGANQPRVGWPRCGEIDVMEYTGNRPTVTTSAAHLAGYSGSQWYTSLVSPKSTTLSTQFHTYAVDWTSSSLTYYRDDVVIGKITRAQVVRHGSWPFDKPFYLVLNLAMGGTYAGRVPASVTTSQRYIIDYVRVYH